MNRIHPLLAVASLFVSIGLPACSSAERVTPRAPAAAASDAPLDARPPDPARPESGMLRVDDAIARACSLPVPEFAFDSARIDGRAAGALDALADCFVEGPMRGRSMKLVGHADPRGGPVYNLGLGAKRAGSVESYLAGRGLSTERIAASSRGDLDARGKDEAGWALDRRVDVSLAD